MNTRTIVIRRQNFGWQQKIKRNTKTKLEVRLNLAGFINPVFVVLVTAVFFGLFYVYAVNQMAVKGIAIRNAEKEIESQKKDNEILKIKEAELKSLYKIEEQSKQMEMINSSEVKYIDNSSMALNDKSKIK